MKPLLNFTALQWISGRPLLDAFKQARNDLLLTRYCREAPPHLHEQMKTIASSLRSSDAPDLLVTIAFEKPQVIELQLSRIVRFGQNVFPIVADNSRSLEARNAIRTICERANVPYIGLPHNSTRHANRSHGMAMQWCYENIVKTIKPGCFAFVDHDLVPARNFNLRSQLGQQPIYGVLWKNRNDTAWQLWAGYCIFDYSAVHRLHLNFLYDFSNGLDTGGRNFSPLYRHLRRGELRFSTNFHAHAAPPIGRAQVIDDCWLHMGGAGHVGNFDDRFKQFSLTLDHLDNLASWSVHGSPFDRAEVIRP